MTAAKANFRLDPEPSPLRGQHKSIIETTGIEVFDVLDVPVTVEVASGAPANGNGVIPFASTLRRIEGSPRG